MIPKLFRTSLLEPEFHFLGIVPYALNVHQRKERMKIVKQFRILLGAF